MNACGWKQAIIVAGGHSPVVSGRPVTVPNVSSQSRRVELSTPGRDAARSTWTGTIGSPLGHAPAAASCPNAAPAAARPHHPAATKAPGARPRARPPGMAARPSAPVVDAGEGKELPGVLVVLDGLQPLRGPQPPPEVLPGPRAPEPLLDLLSRGLDKDQQQVLLLMNSQSQFVLGGGAGRAIGRAEAGLGLGTGLGPRMSHLARVVGAGAAAEEQSPGVPEAAPGEAELVARVAALEVSLAGKEAEVEQAAAELAAREARAERDRAAVAEAKDALAWFRTRQDPTWRDWAGGLPDEVLEKMAAKVVAQNEAGWAARLKEGGWSEWAIRKTMADRKRDGNCLFVFAMVCKGWRKAQLKLGGPLRTRVPSDVLLPGSVTLVKWALAEGCPRQHPKNGFPSMVHVAAEHGHLELVKWLCGEGGLGGFAMDENVMMMAARSGNVELVQWVSDRGCPIIGDALLNAAACGRLETVQWLMMAEGSLAWDETDLMTYAAGSGNLELVRWLCGEGGCGMDEGMCFEAVDNDRVEVLRWLRENGCPWTAETQDRAAAELEYTDDFGNLVDYSGNLE